MLHQFNNFDDFLKKAQEIGVTADLKALLTLDIIFYEEYEDYLMLSLTDFDAASNKIVLLSDKAILTYPEVVNAKHQLYSLKVAKGKEARRETTVTAFLVFKKVLSNYTAYFEKLNKQADHVSDTLDVDDLEDIDRHLKKFGDAVHDFESLLIELEESTFKFIDAEMIGYDYDVLLAKATHLSDRVRGLKKEILAIRSKCEVKFSKELNRNIVRLTQIMALLTIVTVILTVPNTVATMFGVPSLNQLVGLDVFVITMVLTTILATILSYYYIKKWNLKSPS